MPNAALTINKPLTIAPGAIVRLNKPSGDQPLGWSPVLDRFRGQDLTVRDVVTGSTGSYVLFWALSTPARLEHVALRD